QLLRTLLRRRRFRSDSRDLVGIELEHDPAVVGIPLKIGVVDVCVEEFTRSNLRGVPRGNISPEALQLGARKTVLLPVDLKLLLESVGKFLGPGSEREAGGHVADGAALHGVKP